MNRKNVVKSLALAIAAGSVGLYASSSMAFPAYSDTGVFVDNPSKILVTTLTVSDHTGHLVPWDVYYVWVQPKHGHGYWVRKLYEITIYNSYQHYLLTYWGVGAMTYPEYKAQYLADHHLTHARVVTLHPIVPGYTDIQ